MKFIHQLIGVVAFALFAVLGLAYALNADLETQQTLQASLLHPALGLALTWLALKLLSLRLRYFPLELTSLVQDHTGPCAPVWVNHNRIHYMQTGAVTGFFRSARRLGRLPLVWLTGPQFHGCLRQDQVLSSNDLFGRRSADYV